MGGESSPADTVPVGIEICSWVLAPGDREDPARAVLLGMGGWWGL